MEQVKELKKPFRWKNAIGYLVDGVKANVKELREALKKIN